MKLIISSLLNISLPFFFEVHFIAKFGNYYFFSLTFQTCSLVDFWVDVSLKKKQNEGILLGKVGPFSKTNFSSFTYFA